MNLFKKKDDIPEIPIAPSLPELNFDNRKINNGSLNLPAPNGDSRDLSNRDIIKSAIEDSSEKNNGDNGGLSSPPDFQESTFQIKEPPKKENVKTFAELSMPPKKDAGLPELPKYNLNKKAEEPRIPDMPQVEERLLEPEELGITKDDTASPSQTVKKDFNETIFVRIDKFNSAKRDVDEIGRDMKQIENVLEKIMDVKMKEDEEISELNKNIEEIKIRLGRIDNEIFNRI
jgi:hypothetical protein